MKGHLKLLTIAVLACLTCLPGGARSQESERARPDSVTVRLVDVDLAVAVQSLAQYLDRPVSFGTLGQKRVTLEMPEPVPRTQVAALLRGILENQGLELVLDSGGLYVIREVATPESSRRGAAQREPSAQSVPELFVIRLRHARALDVAATVNALYGQAAALGELGRQPATLSQELARNRVAEQPQPEAVQSVAGRAASLTGDVTIVPDPSTNSLLVRASASDFELIQAAVQELDVRPLQALIEVLIVEARRDKSMAYGLGAVLGETEIEGTDGTLISGSTTGLSLGDLVVHIMGVGGIDLDGVLTAAAARGDVSIVSRPVVVTANNERADILVGSQRPFVQVSRSLPTDAPIRDQVVQYKDVGTSLSVTPTINSGGYVMLELSQEVNAATTETAFDAPVISTRSLQTRLLVKDGQTIVLGGLVDRQHDESSGGVPLLSDLPILGGLFGRRSSRTVETELFLFITPRIIQTDMDADSLTAPLLKRSRKEINP